MPRPFLRMPPTAPIDRMLPALPIERMLPALPIDRTEPFDFRDRQTGSAATDLAVCDRSGGPSAKLRATRAQPDRGVVCA